MRTDKDVAMICWSESSFVFDDGAAGQWVNLFPSSLPEDYGFLAERVNAFLTDTFDFFLDSSRSVT